MTLPLPLPMTVIGGYLGAGKTTLINRLLAEPHGMRLTLLVNDFGAINIDAALLASVTEDTIELTNGCVCCTMGADLFMAIAAILDRPHHPNHLIVEASGIADPASIARAAIAEPDLSYGGIVTVVDGLHYPATSTDPLVAAQVQGQVRCADYVLVSKTDGLPPPLQTSLQGQTTAPISALSAVDAVAPIVIGGFETPDAPLPTAGHGHFQSWSLQSQQSFDREALIQKLSTRPVGLYRVKGTVRGVDTGFSVQIVGRQVEITPIPQPTQTVLVAIGPTSEAITDKSESWWTA